MINDSIFCKFKQYYVINNIKIDDIKKTACLVV